MGDLFDPYAFAVGMVALLNPCGFALLPAYLGFFLGQQDDDEVHPVVALNRAQLVGLSLTLGFMVVFGVIGIVLAGLQSTIQPALPYVSVAIGVGLVILAIAMLRGFSPMVRLPKLERGTGSRSVGSVFLFGVSYAVASLSCTIAVFFAAVGTSTSGAGFVDRLGGFLSYGLGMGLLATALTLAVATGRRGVVNRFRAALTKVDTIAALILLIVGPYVALYGIWEIQVERDSITPWIDDVITTALAWQASLAIWIDQRSTLLGWGFLAINVALIAAGVVVRQQRPPASTAH